MRNKSISAAMAVGIAVSASGASIAGDKYALKVPEGLAFSEFKGYETWQAVSVSHPTGAADAAMSGETINIILANPVMIKAYAAGIPGNGKPFPDGSKAVKLLYKPKMNTEAPFKRTIPESLKDVAFMSKDSKKFSASGGWGYALFNYDAAADTFKPNGKGTACGVGCHTVAKAKDYVFTPFEKR